MHKLPVVQLVFKGHDHIKADQIIEAAQLRFGLYGFEKTTMKEIARDLNMSKGSLYYYFPDKENLYKAIVLKENEMFIRAIRQELVTPALQGIKLRKLVLTRLEVFKKLLNLSHARMDTYPNMHAFMRETMTELRKQEKEIIMEILSNGISTGEFEVKSTEETADLLLDLLKGLRLSLLSGASMINLQEGLDQMVKKSELLLDIYIKGISKKQN